MASSIGVWGIDLGLCALKAIRLQKVDGAVKATAFEYIEHPKILSQPDADPDALTREALEQFLSRNNIRGDMVVISVPGQSGLARFVKLPPVEERKIADIVKFEAKQQIPFPLDEVVWDVQKIGRPQVTDGLALDTEIGLFAMKKDVIQRNLAQFREALIECHIVQMAPLALINFVTYDLLNKDRRIAGAEGDEDTAQKCVVALDIGTDNSNLVISDGEKIIWQRPIPLGGNHFTRALTKDMKLTFAKAEHLKRNAVKSPDLRKILASLKSVLNDFVGEVQRSLGYFTNTHRDATIQYMVGLGGAFRLPGLQKFLQEKLQLEVRKISKFNRMEGDDVLASPQFIENILSFAVPYGLALQGLKLSKMETNLLPHEVKVERLVRGKKPWAVAAAASLLIAVAGLTYGRSLESKSVNNPDILKATKEAKDIQTAAKKANDDFDNLEKELKKSDESLRRIVAGVEERFNWQLLNIYINCALPQPDGGKVVDKNFFNADARKAFNLFEMKRVPGKLDKAKQDPGEALNNDEFIKKNLLQIGIEGMYALYTEDVPTYFKNIKREAPLLKAMPYEEQAIVSGVDKMLEDEKTKSKVPDKGWVVEIRGYTYHHDAENFIKLTFVDNLRNPYAVNPQLFPPADRKGTAKGVVDRKLFDEQIMKQVSFLFLYKNELVENPLPGQFVHIKNSHLPYLLKPDAKQAGPVGPGAVDPAAQAGAVPDPTKLNRDAWSPIGEVARQVHGGGGAGGIGPGGQKFVPNVGGGVAPAKGPVVEKAKRREFVVLFLWREPIKSAMTADAKKDDK